MSSSITFNAAGTQEQVASVVTAVLLDQYSLEEDQLTVDVTLSRRLVTRQLSSSDPTAWQVDFEITANKDVVNDAVDIAASQASGTGDALSSFTSALDAAFEAVGVTLDVSSVVISQPVVNIVIPATTTGPHTSTTLAVVTPLALEEETEASSTIIVIVIISAVVVLVMLAVLLFYFMRCYGGALGVGDPPANEDNNVEAAESNNVGEGRYSPEPVAVI